MPRLHVRQYAIEPVVAARQGLAQASHPVLDGLETRLVHAARPRGAVDPAGDEAGPLEDLEVTRDRRLRHLEGLDQLHHGGLASRETREDGTPCRVGQGEEGRVQVLHN